MAMGFGMAQEMMRSMQQPAAGASPAGDPFAPPVAPPTPAAAPAASAAPQVLTPAQAALALGVSEGDVLAEISAGHLKARQIGSQWRIAQSALDEFLRG